MVPARIRILATDERVTVGVPISETEISTVRSGFRTLRRGHAPLGAYVPQTETQGRIHTSAITVAALPEAEDIDIQVVQANG
jgi:hypothetical protein